MTEKQNKSIVIGITGGISSGKTTAAKIIEKRGYPVIYTDEIAKRVMVQDSPVKNKIISTFGEESYLPGGKINKKYLAEKVFSGNSSSKALEKLNRIVHPPVIEKMSDEVENYEKSGSKLIFVESALIFEAGLEEGFDYIVTVDADDEIRMKRYIEKTGEAPDTAAGRIKEQMPAEEKKKLADFVINNNGGLEQLNESISFFLNIFESMTE